jgi:hypothetical protein
MAEPDPDEIKKVAKVMADEKKRVLKELKRAALKYRNKYEVARSFYADMGKERNSWAWYSIEVWGGADYPKPALQSKAKKAVATLEAAVKGQLWAKIKGAFLAAERDVNVFHKAVNDYYNDFQGGANSSITILKWTKTAGFISVGVLATTFVGGPLALAAGLEGAKGAALAAASGAFLKTHVDTVATTVGRELAGEDVDYGKVAWNSLCDSAGNAIIGAIFQGPPAKWLNDKVAKTVVKDFISNKETMAITSRLGVAATRTLLIKWVQSDGQKEVKAAAPKVAKKLKGKETEQEVFTRVLGTAANSKAFADFLKKEEAKAKK